MAYTTVPTVATGDLWSAANHNTYIKDNLSALFVGTTAGDIDYYTSASTKSRLAAVNGGVLKSSGSAPSWLAMGNSFRVLTANTTTNEPQWSSIVNYRQGGSATSWQTSGTTNQTITDGIMQIGVLSVTTNVAGIGSADITFTLPFQTGKIPWIIGTVQGGVDYLNVNFSDVTETSAKARVARIDGGAGTYSVNWMALGCWT
jgi:hypothetical protein